MRSMTGILLVLMAAVVSLQVVHERRGGPPASTSENLLYVRSADAMTRLALSYDALLADVYWIRTIQHYGGTRLSTDPNKRYELLYPLLDLTTSLDPRFNVAFYFGAVFLAEPFPGGPGRPDLSITLLEKGLQAQPDKWEFAQAIGFVHYWWLQEYEEAAAWFMRASEFPDAPIWMRPLAATTLAEGGNRESSRRLWQQFAEVAEDEWFRNEALRRLTQLDAMDQLDRLRAVVADFQQTYGAYPAGWGDLVRAGYLPGVPLDPTRTPYRLESGSVSLDPGSPLNPLPIEPRRLP